METQHPEAMAQITRLEQKAPYKVQEETAMLEKPHFGRALRNQERLIEGQAIHMEATLTPVNDPTMKVEWFFNGQPIPSGKYNISCTSWNNLIHVLSPSIEGEIKPCFTADRLQ